ncbi:hypothetical protein KL86PLE_40861 [uncultured Pleomorphomonas sp.]|uniref:Uncharacterized protein n=1 Tax=uncultured Pleomorphomonas sp. TaxID=442121 RepID=A0A212LHM2_9HYPH|nr:hypothetical protein KL86PLE_40861 [uncultured Pleomorphomonas sp.]
MPPDPLLPSMPAGAGQKKDTLAAEGGRTTTAATPPASGGEPFVPESLRKSARQNRMAGGADLPFPTGSFTETTRLSRPRPHRPSTNGAVLARDRPTRARGLAEPEASGFGGTGREGKSSHRHGRRVIGRDIFVRGRNALPAGARFHLGGTMRCKRPDSIGLEPRTAAGITLPTPSHA